MLKTVSKFRSGRVMLLLALSVLLAPAVVFGQGAPFSGPATVSLSPAAQNIAPGANFTVDVMVDLTGVTGTCAGAVPAILGGYVIPIDFDNTQVTYVGVAACPTAPPQFAVAPTATAAGTANANGEVAISASQADPTGPTGLICVARLTFTLSLTATLPTTLTPDCVGTFNAFSLSSQFIIGCAGSPASMAGTCVASTVTPLAAQADLVIVKTDSADPVTTGTNFTYTLAVTNNGPDPATNVVVVDTLPIPGVAYVSSSAGCVFVSPTVTCTAAALASGATTTFTITVTAGAVGVVTNNVTVTATEPDPTPAADTEDTTIILVPAAADIPTLSQWGLIALALGLAALGFSALRRRKQAPLA